MAYEPLNTEQFEEMVQYIVDVSQSEGLDPDHPAEVGKWFYDNLMLVITKYKEIKDYDFEIIPLTMPDYGILAPWLVTTAMSDGVVDESVHMIEYWFFRLEILVDKYIEIKGL